MKIKKAVSIKSIRHGVQAAMTAFLIYVGWQFYHYVAHVQSGGTLPFVAKPPAVEGFLPLSALLALKQLLVTGVFDAIHPAGLSIFLAVLIMAVIFKKGFCSWFCPIGAVSELLAVLGEKVFGRNFSLPVWADRVLMSLKYLLLGFFVKVIFFDMSVEDVQAFLYSPYNLLADIKMLYFFLNISKTALIVIMFLIVFSLFVKLFWCRYLCPYGAVQGLISMLSLFKVRRSKELCTNCRSCDRSCPAALAVSEKQTVFSPECTGCLNCISACPVENCLSVSAPKRSWHIKPLAYPALIVGSFLTFWLAAKLTGHWESAVDIEMIYAIAPYLDMFGHP